MAQQSIPVQVSSDDADDLDQARFFNKMIGSLCETIEDVVGLEDAESFIGIVGRRIGNSALADFPADQPTSAEAIAAHLVDFKAKIGGGFEVEEIDGNTITFSNCRCPFADEALGRPSLCKMTTNVFGRVAANATGYSRVKIDEALSRGDNRCLVTVQLARTEGNDDDGQEFYA